jgi:hypothetical protein
MNPKRQIQKLIDDLKTKKFREGEAKELTKTYGEEIKKQLTPAFEGLSKQMTEAMKGQFADAISNIKVDIPKNEAPQVSVNVPETIFPEFPQIPAPIVRVAAPIVNIPEFKFPEEMSVRGWVGLMGVDIDHPLPVQLRDADGKPVSLSQGLMGIAGGGGKADFLTIKGFSQSAFSEITNPDGRLKVELPTGSSGLTDAELRATAVPVIQVSGAADSVYVTGAAASTYAEIMNPDGRVKVELPTGSSGLTDTELRASSLDVQQASGATWSVSVNDIFRTTVASNLINSDDRLRVSLEPGGSGLTDTELRATSLPVSQVSGASWSVEATITGTPTVQATNLDIRDLDYTTDDVSVYQVSGASWSVSVANPVAQGDEASALRVVVAGNSAVSVTATQTGTWNVGTVTTVTGVTNSVAAALTNSTGVQYSGSNPLPVYLVLGSGNSTISVGPVAADVADDGSAPVKGGGIARTANPTAVAANDVVTSTHDDLGRQITRPVQVRDLIQTAYVSVTNGTETTLLAGSTGSFHDLIMLVGSNNSDAAVSVAIRAVTAGNIVNTLMIPANGTAGFAPTVPWPQDATGNNWTVDGPDETGRTLTFSALFSREV